MDPSYTNGVGTQIPQQPVISSGTGDIVLSGGEAPKKSRKGVVILIVLVVVLALVGGGFLLWQNGVFGGGSNSQSQAASLEEKYNSYIDYVLYGENSVEKYSIDGIENWTPYFAGLEGDELESYLQNANTKYADLETVYSQYNTVDKVNIVPMKV